jgi:hypothetical protein
MAEQPNCKEHIETVESKLIVQVENELLIFIDHLLFYLYMYLRLFGGVQAKVFMTFQRRSFQVIRSLGVIIQLLV